MNKYMFKSMGSTALYEAANLEGLEKSQQGTPWDGMEIRAAKNALLASYIDPFNTVVNDAYVDEMFSQSLLRTPDTEKLGWGQKALGTEYIMPIHGPDEIQQKAADMPLLGGGVEKAVLDTAISGGNTGGGVLARIDLVPEVFVWFWTEFAALNRIARVPSKGIDHSWNNLIALGDDNDGFLDEFGCPSPSKGVYFRGSTNIAILGVERGTSLKLEFGIAAGGLLYNGGMSSYDLEMKNAITVRARILQKCFFQGTTASTQDGTHQYGLTFTNGFNGLRVLLSELANTVHSNFYPAGYGPVIFEQSATGTIADAIDAAAAQIWNNGGRPTAVYCSTRVARKLRGEVSSLIRYTEDNAVTGAGLIVGGHVSAIDTVAGLLPIIVVPNDSIGTYNVGSIATDGGTTLLTSSTCEDVYVLSEDKMQLPYLGSPDPMPIEIPIGIPDAGGGACLTRRFIIYMMIGLAITVPVHQAKVRVPVA
jgi:hypothetical protein